MEPAENFKESDIFKDIFNNNNKRAKNFNYSIADKTGIFSNGEAFHSLNCESNDTPYVCSG